MNTANQNEKQNNYKMLFIISLTILLGSVIYSVYLFKSLSSNFKGKEQVSEETQTPKVNPEDNQLKLTTYIEKNGEVVNLVLDKNGQKTVVDSFDKQHRDIDDDSIFTGMKFTATGKYLTYGVTGVTEPGGFYIYNTQTQSFVRDITVSPDTTAFSDLGDITLTNDEKYLIYCQSGGYLGAEARIINLSDSSVKYDFLKPLGDEISPDISCSYDMASDAVNFMYYKSTEEETSSGVKSLVRFNLDTGLVE